MSEQGNLSSLSDRIALWLLRLPNFMYLVAGIVFVCGDLLIQLGFPNLRARASTGPVSIIARDAAVIIFCFVIDAIQYLLRQQIRQGQYLDSLRAYSVGNIEPLRQTIDALKLVNEPVPDLHAPVPFDGGDKPLHTKERNTLLKLVIGMAIDSYQFDPKGAKSAVPKQIADDLAKHGISIDDDTVRKYLKQAADTVLPGNPRQH